MCLFSDDKIKIVVGSSTKKKSSPRNIRACDLLGQAVYEY